MWVIALACGVTLFAPAIGGRPGEIGFALGVAALPPAFLVLATAGRRDRVTTAAMIAFWGVLSVGLVGVVVWPPPAAGGEGATAAAAVLAWILVVLCAVPLVIVATAFARWQRRNPAPRDTR